MTGPDDRPPSRLTLVMVGLFGILAAVAFIAGIVAQFR